MALVLAGAGRFDGQSPLPPSSRAERTAAAVPLFRDPIHDGAADPVVIWNRARKTWWIFYTNRRADLDDPNGVTWVHGTHIGIAESADGGAHWHYVSEADFPYGQPDYTFWAPEVIDVDGTYHMFLTVVPGTFDNWQHPRHILHLTSKDLLHWKPLDNVNLESDRTIDACVFRLPNGDWRLWYKNEADSSKVYFSDSPDLVHWTPKGIATTNHGEGPVVRYEIDESGDGLRMRTILPLAQISFSRALQLCGNFVRILETVESFAKFDRPIAWTQHVTLGPPFLDPATTTFRASMTRSAVANFDPGFDAYLKKDAAFDWPNAPRKDGGISDLCQMQPNAPASGYTAHLADPLRQDAYFVAYSPRYQLAFGYLWKRRDFPWMGIWEENCSRQQTPWNGRCITRGMEFGVSPFPESRCAMVGRCRLFDVPTYRWLRAMSRQDVEYWIYCQPSTSVPQAISAPHPAAKSG